MQKLFRRWFGGAAADHAAVREWAQSQGHRFATTRGAEGFVIEPNPESGGGWRAEWGPSQREYIPRNELRVRAEVSDAGDLQMLLITRQLVSLLEAHVFNQFTEGNQTRIDDSTPEEMRWLVLYPQVPRSVLGSLRERFAALSNLPAAAPMWLEGALASRLETSNEWLSDGVPMALIVQRGRFVLRLAHEQANATVIASAIGLASVAVAAARRVAGEVARGAVGSQRPSSWGAPSSMPNHEPR